MKDSELSKLLEEALEHEKGVVKSICHNALREELYGEKLQGVVIFHLESFVKNIFDLAICQDLVEYDNQNSTPRARARSPNHNMRKIHF